MSDEVKEKRSWGAVFTGVLGLGIGALLGGPIFGLLGGILAGFFLKDTGIFDGMIKSLFGITSSPTPSQGDGVRPVNGLPAPLASTTPEKSAEPDKEKTAAPSTSPGGSETPASPSTSPNPSGSAQPGGADKTTWGDVTPGDVAAATRKLALDTILGNMGLGLAVQLGKKIVAAVKGTPGAVKAAPGAVKNWAGDMWHSKSPGEFARNLFRPVTSPVKGGVKLSGELAGIYDPHGERPWYTRWGALNVVGNTVNISRIAYNAVTAPLRWVIPDVIRPTFVEGLTPSLHWERNFNSIQRGIIFNRSSPFSGTTLELTYTDPADPKAKAKVIATRERATSQWVFNEDGIELLKKNADSAGKPLADAQEAVKKAQENLDKASGRDKATAQQKLKEAQEALKAAERKARGPNWVDRLVQKTKMMLGKGAVYTAPFPEGHPLRPATPVISPTPSTPAASSQAGAADPLRARLSAYNDVDGHKLKGLLADYDKLTPAQKAAANAEFEALHKTQGTKPDAVAELVRRAGSAPSAAPPKPAVPPTLLPAPSAVEPKPASPPVEKVKATLPKPAGRMGSRVKSFFAGLYLAITTRTSGAPMPAPLVENAPAKPTVNPGNPAPKPAADRSVPTEPKSTPEQKANADAQFEAEKQRQKALFANKETVRIKAGASVVSEVGGKPVASAGGGSPITPNKTGIGARVGVGANSAVGFTFLLPQLAKGDPWAWAFTAPMVAEVSGGLMPAAARGVPWAAMSGGEKAGRALRGFGALTGPIGVYGGVMEMKEGVHRMESSSTAGVGAYKIGTGTAGVTLATLGTGAAVSSGLGVLGVSSPFLTGVNVVSKVAGPLALPLAAVAIVDVVWQRCAEINGPDKNGERENMLEGRMAYALRWHDTAQSQMDGLNSAKVTNKYLPLDYIKPSQEDYMQLNTLKFSGLNPNEGFDAFVEKKKAEAADELNKTHAYLTRNNFPKLVMFSGPDDQHAWGDAERRKRSIDKQLEGVAKEKYGMDPVTVEIKESGKKQTVQMKFKCYDERKKTAEEVERICKERGGRCLFMYKQFQHQLGIERGTETFTQEEEYLFEQLKTLNGGRELTKAEKLEHLSQNILFARIAEMGDAYQNNGIPIQKFIDEDKEISKILGLDAVSTEGDYSQVTWNQAREAQRNMLLITSEDRLEAIARKHWEETRQYVIKNKGDPATVEVPNMREAFGIQQVPLLTRIAKDRKVNIEGSRILGAYNLDSVGISESDMAWIHSQGVQLYSQSCDYYGKGAITITPGKDYTGLPDTMKITLHTETASETASYDAATNKFKRYPTDVYSVTITQMIDGKEVVRKFLPDKPITLNPNTKEFSENPNNPGFVERQLTYDAESMKRLEGWLDQNIVDPYRASPQTAQKQWDEWHQKREGVLAKREQEKVEKEAKEAARLAAINDKSPEALALRRAQRLERIALYSAEVQRMVDANKDAVKVEPVTDGSGKKNGKLRLVLSSNKRFDNGVALSVAEMKANNPAIKTEADAVAAAKERGDLSLLILMTNEVRGALKWKDGKRREDDLEFPENLNDPSLGSTSRPVELELDPQNPLHMQGLRMMLPKKVYDGVMPPELLKEHPYSAGGNERFVKADPSIPAVAPTTPIIPPTVMPPELPPVR